jgi:hypothetical protein
MQGLPHASSIAKMIMTWQYRQYAVVVLITENAPREYG